MWQSGMMPRMGELTDRELDRLGQKLGLNISDATKREGVVKFTAQPPTGGPHRHGAYFTATGDRWLSDVDCAC